MKRSECAEKPVSAYKMRTMIGLKPLDGDCLPTYYLTLAHIHPWQYHRYIVE